MTDFAHNWPKGRVGQVDYYKILEVDREASPEVIQKAYRALSMKYHPDRQPSRDHSATVSKMQQLNEAYKVLSNPARRSAYDVNRDYWRIWVNDGLIGLTKAWLINETGS